MTHELPFSLPAQVQADLQPSGIVLRGLLNPRGLRFRNDGALLLVEAGSGDPAAPFSGRLLQFAPDGAGGFLPPSVIASGFRSMNMQARMCRDEIFGLADVAAGSGECAGQWRLSQTDYVDGSRILEIGSAPPETLIRSHGNLNALCYHPQRHSWLTVKPDANQLLEWLPGAAEAVRANLPPLASGQNAVPVNLVYEAGTQTVLVSLFSGELRRDPGKTGIEFEARSGAIVRVDLDDGSVTPVATGLTLPTGLALTPQGQLLVLELCDDFLEPMPPAGVPTQAWHGGFKRYSGRLLCFDLISGQVTALAQQLDTPSNLCIRGNSVFVSEGMGLPGRPILNAAGTCVPLEGMVRQITLPARLI